MLQRYRTQIAGELRDTAQIQIIKSPYNGDIVAEVGEASASDLELAIERAHTAFESGQRPATHERAELLDGIARTLRDRSAELAELITRESGKPLRYSRAEVARAALTFTLGAGESRRLGGEVLAHRSIAGHRRALVLVRARATRADRRHLALQFSDQLGGAQALAGARGGRADGLEARPTKPAHRARARRMAAGARHARALAERAAHDAPRWPKGWSPMNAWPCSRSPAAMPWAFA